MDIVKLTPNVDEIKRRLNNKLASLDKGELAEEPAFALLTYVEEYKKWSKSATDYSKDASLQKLPVEYYQICARHSQSLYEQAVRVGIPRLIDLGILDKDGKLI